MNSDHRHDKSDKRDILEKFELVRASPEYAERNSPQRRVELPEYSPAQKLLLSVLLLPFLAVGFFTVLFGAVALSIGAVSVGVPLLVFGLLIVGILALAWGAWRRRLYQLESAPLSTTAVVVTDKRKVVSRSYVRSRKRTSGVEVSVQWFVTCEDEEGNSQEYELFNPATVRQTPIEKVSHIEHAPEPEFPLYSKMRTGDAGVLYSRQNIALRFEKVC